MTRPLRYFLFGLIFLFGFIGFILGDPTMKISMIAIAVLIGVLADGIDNARDRPFKKYNSMHGHYKK